MESRDLYTLLNKGEHGIPNGFNGQSSGDKGSISFIGTVEGGGGGGPDARKHAIMGKRCRCGTVVAEKDYLAKRGKRRNPRPKTGAKRYKIHFGPGFDPKSDSFYEDACDSVLSYGTLIGEFKVKTDYDWTGKKNLYLGKGKFEIIEGKREPGHAVVLTGYGEACNGVEKVLIFEYLNSYGENWGKNGGFGQISADALHFVYKTKVRPWWR